MILFIRFIPLLLAAALLLPSCGPKNSVPSSRARKVSMKQSPSSFRAKRDRKSKPGQMGFYKKRERRGVFEAISFRVRHTFSSKKKRHVIGNERRPASSSYNKKRRKGSIGKMNNSFVKGRHRAKRGRNKQGDHTSDSFSRNPNRKKKFLFIFNRK